MQRSETWYIYNQFSFCRFLILSFGHFLPLCPKKSDQPWKQHSRAATTSYIITARTERAVKKKKSLKQSTHTSLEALGLVHILEHSVHRGMGGGRRVNFDLVCTDTGREGGVWSIQLAERLERGLRLWYSRAFFYEWRLKEGMGRRGRGGGALPVTHTRKKIYEWLPSFNPFRV